MGNADESTPVAGVPKIGKVINVNELPDGVLPANTIFIDAGSQWANPFVIGRDGDRAACVSRYNLLLANSEPTLMDIDHLRGKDVSCYCGDTENLCHGHTLVYLASITYRARLDWAAKVIESYETERALPPTIQVPQSNLMAA